MLGAYGCGMADIDSRDYFRKRAEEERDAAEAASDERAAQPHRELAQRYERKAQTGEGQSEEEDLLEGPPPSDFTIVP